MFWDFYKTGKYGTYLDILLAMAREKLVKVKTEEEREKTRRIIIGIKNLKIEESNN